MSQFTKAVKSPLADRHSCFLAGPLVAGQRQALIERLCLLLESGVPGYAILVLLQDRATARRFRQEVDRLDLGPYGAGDLQTYYGLASRLIRQFWPLVAKKPDIILLNQNSLPQKGKQSQYILETVSRAP